MLVKTVLARITSFERSFLSDPAAVWDVQLAKLMCLIAGVMLAKAFPTILMIETHWLLALAALAAWLPASRAFHLFQSEFRSDKSPSEAKVS